ncbi:MAG TPA: hypothetical protein VNZ03_12025 [Terriglobales bacterium]|nr:hypothetical protein [Terriglobales bacterium]
MNLPERQSKSSSTAAAEPCSARSFDFAQGRLTRASVPTWFFSATRLLLSTLREIFDETAYARFLARHETSSCPRTYSAFLREQEGIKARRPKCC